MEKSLSAREKAVSMLHPPYPPISVGSGAWFCFLKSSRCAVYM